MASTACPDTTPPLSLTPQGETCPWWIPNCLPKRNSLKECHFSCGAYCQALRADGPCLSGDAAGEFGEQRDCKFGYRGTSLTPDLSLKEESGWLEHKKYWGEGGPTDCMTCPVGFKIKPLYGDGTGACIACDDGWIDTETGAILEDGCAGAEYVKMEFGEEPGMKKPTDEYEVVAGCKAEFSPPVVGMQVLAAIPDEVKEKDPFFYKFDEPSYLATVYGVDSEEEVMSVKYADGGPLLSLKEGLPIELGAKGYVPVPMEGDKVTLSADYWDACCNETAGGGYSPGANGPLELGDVGEVSSVLPPEAGEFKAISVLAPNGQRWMYGVGDVLKVIGEVKCRLPGRINANSVGAVANKVPEDPRCCCCARDLWVGCWGWCGDTTESQKPMSYPQEKAVRFRAGHGMDITDPRYMSGGKYEGRIEGKGTGESSMLATSDGGRGGG